MTPEEQDDTGFDPEDPPEWVFEKAPEKPSDEDCDEWHRSGGDATLGRACAHPNQKWSSKAVLLTRKSPLGKPTLL